MSLVTSREIILNAQKSNYAVGAFNVENMEMIQAVVAAAEEMRAPVIIQTTPSTVKYGTLDLFYANVHALAKKAAVPIALHLDHGNSFDLAACAIKTGYTSIMIDGSHLSFEENIDLTKRVVSVAKPNDIPVEAELGKVGGKEDDLDGGDGGLTDPKEAAEFAERTGVDFLAIGIGTAHGIYKGVPKIDVGRLIEIRKNVSIPLVLHGTSGIPDNDVKRCVSEGICKVNYATELRLAYSDGVKSALRENPDIYDPKKYGAVGREYVKSCVTRLISVCGCENKI